MSSKLSIIEEIGFDFHWDSKKVWALDEPVVEINIQDLLWHFDIPFWDKEGTDDYNLTPWEVIREPEKHKIHYQLCQEADACYPIDVMENKGRFVILDGLHRLVKLHLNGNTQIRVRNIPRSRIAEIKIEKP